MTTRTRNKALAAMVDTALAEAFARAGITPTTSSKAAPKPAQPERWSPSMRTEAEQAAQRAMDAFFEGARVGNTATPRQAMDSFAKVGEARPQQRQGFDLARGRFDRDAGRIVRRWATANAAAAQQQDVDRARDFAEATGKLSDTARAALGLDVPPRR